MSRRGWILAGFLALLVLSHAVRQMWPTPPERRAGQKVVTLPAFTAAERTVGKVELAYQDIPGAAPEAPVLVLVHGSPVASRALENLVAELEGRFRLIVPDLPGFGGSTTRVPDYSIRAHARYTLALLDRLGIERAHFAGYSMGGGVILNVAEIEPERVTSLAMIAAIGVQELEMLGDYTLNHALYGAQYAGLWLMRELLPHFGYLDNAIVGVSYARNFLDTDQRPLRGTLVGYDGPMLIVHGKEDGFVPPVVAREHARLVPQARLVLYEGGHLVPVTAAGQVAEPLAGFLGAVEAGEATRRSDVSEKARQGALAPMPDYMRGLDDAGLVFLLGALVLGTQLSEDLTTIGAGILAARGVAPFWPAVAACFAGIFIGDVLIYLAGRYLGRGALRRRPLKWLLNERDIDRSLHWFHRRGATIVFASRFIPGSRVPAYFTAGLLRVPLPRFLLFFVLAAAVWTPFLAGAAYYAGDRFLSLFGGFEAWALLLVLVFFAAVMGVLRLVVPLFSWRGRRLLRGRWRRWTRWEYWPLRLFYTPVFLRILYLGIKYKAWTAFTAANPALPYGGMIGESKARILEGLGRGNPALPPWVLLPVDESASERMEKLDALVDAHALVWPVILKPDRGERGAGVVKAADRGEARAAIAAAGDDLIAQAFVGGHEYGVFYYRMPGEERGRVLGITDKRIPTVTGDGRRSLEEIILADEALLAMAPHYLGALGRRIESVPANGEVVRLTHVGTHCRGAVFLEAMELCTPELEAAVDAIARPFEGFYFGRFDLMAPDARALGEGRELTVIELNGVTSEVTSIYDPKHSIWHGWRTLFRQWEIAFRIGKANRDRGAPAPLALELLRLWWVETRRAREGA